MDRLPNCINKKDIYKYFAVANIINMEKEKKKECLNIIERNFLYGKNFPFLKILEICEHPKFDFVDFWKFPLNFLKKKLKTNQFIIQRIEKYISFRKFKKSVENANILIKYFEKSIFLVKEIIEENK